MIEITSTEYRKMKKNKISKYHNKKIEFNGEIFDSIKERDRWVELKILEATGDIKDLQRQVGFLLISSFPGQRSVTYKADFTYYEGDKLIVEDCKGFKTQVYLLKKKLMRAVHNIVIRES